MLTVDPLYPTTDPHLAAFLMSEGGRLVGMARVTAKKVEYRFLADARLHALLRTYWRGQPILVSPRRLFAAFRYAKSRAAYRH